MRLRVAGSTQCTSSRTSTRVLSSPNVSSSSSTESFSRSGYSKSAFGTGRSGNTDAGRSDSSRDMPGPAAAAIPSAPKRSQSARTIPRTGAKGTLTDPRSTHSPTQTTASGSTRATNSRTSRDLPMPASPPMTTARGMPERAFRSSSSSVSSSPSRPTIVGLDAVETMPHGLTVTPPRRERSDAARLEWPGSLRGRGAP